MTSSALPTFTPPRPSNGGFIQRLWDNIYDPERSLAANDVNSLKTDVRSQLKRGQSMRQLLRVVETVLEGTVEPKQAVEAKPVVSTESEMKKSLSRPRASFPTRKVVNKKAKTSWVGTEITAYTPVNTSSRRQSKIVSFNSFVQFMKRKLNGRSDRRSEPISMSHPIVDPSVKSGVSKKKHQNPFISALLY